MGLCRDLTFALEGEWGIWNPFFLLSFVSSPTNCNFHMVFMELEVILWFNSDMAFLANLYYITVLYLICFIGNIKDFSHLWRKLAVYFFFMV